MIGAISRLRIAGLFFSTIVLISCQGKQETPLEKLQREVREDSIDRVVRKRTDSMVKSIKTNIYWDTANIAEAPIIVTSAKLSRGEYSSYKDVVLTFKNVSGKKVEAIRFRWYCLNAFGEPADMSGLLEPGFGAGYTEDPLRPGKSDNATWDGVSRNAKKIVKAWATEAVFDDGTKWEAKSQD